MNRALLQWPLKNILLQAWRDDHLYCGAAWRGAWWTIRNHPARPRMRGLSWRDWLHGAAIKLLQALIATIRLRRNRRGVIVDEFVDWP